MMGRWKGGGTRPHLITIISHREMRFLAGLRASSSGGDLFRPETLFGSVGGAVHNDFPPVVYHERYSAKPWPAKNSFPMSKFSDLAELLAKPDGPLGAAGPVAMGSAFRPMDRPPHEWFEAVHDPDYYRGFLEGTLDEKAMRRIGLPYSETLVDRTLLEVSGTVLTARLALKFGLACNLAGGTHHAHKHFGSGYTILNDLAVASRVVQADGTAESAGKKVAVTIVDCDVHQGDGTATIFKDDPSVRTISFHCRENFPDNKPASDVDAAFPAGTGDDHLLKELRRVLPNEFALHPPDLVLYDAGVDMHAGDRLGKMMISDEGLLARDYYVISTCLQSGVPVACVVGGGYDSDKGILAARHSTVFRAAFQAWREFDGRARWR